MLSACSAANALVTRPDRESYIQQGATKCRSMMHWLVHWLPHDLIRQFIAHESVPRKLQARLAQPSDWKAKATTRPCRLRPTNALIIDIYAQCTVRCRTVHSRRPGYRETGSPFRVRGCWMQSALCALAYRPHRPMSLSLGQGFDNACGLRAGRLRKRHEPEPGQEVIFFPYLEISP